MDFAKDYLNIKTFLLIGISILCHVALLCQANSSFIFKNISTADGLPANIVGAITKDDLGFIWFGTSDGLCRYEGPNGIKVFRAGEPAIEGGLESSNIRSLFFDSKNNLWIGTRLGGLTKFHQPSGVWKTYRHDKKDPSTISNDEILTIAEDQEGRIWVGTEDGLNVFNPDTEQFVNFKVDPKDPNAIKGKAILSVIVDYKGRIWAGTWAGGLNLLLPSKDGEIANATFKTFLPSEQLEAQHIWKIYQDRQNRFWLGTRGAGLFLMELPPEADDDLTQDWEPRFHAYSDSEEDKGVVKKYLEDIYQDQKGNLWIGTVDGLSHISADQLNSSSLNLDASKKPIFNFQHFHHEANNPNTIANNNLISIFEDDQGLVWLSTMSGVSVYNWFTNQFDIFDFDKLSSETEIQSFYVDKQGIAWIGNTEEGLFRYDFQKQKKLDANADQLALLENYVSCFYSPDDRQLYLGTGSGVTVYDMLTKQGKNYPLPSEIENQFNEFVIRSILKEDEQRIWVGAQQGLYSLDVTTGAYAAYPHEVEDPRSISDNAINHIIQDSKGEIWITTYNGLNKVLVDASGAIEFERFFHDASNPENSIPSNQLSPMEEIDGVIYIGSNNGLCAYDIEKESFTNYNQKNKYRIQSLEKTADGNLWAGTGKGIIFFNTKTLSYNQYDKEDGLGDVIFKSIASHRDKQGNLYFGSRKSITKFHPSELKSNEIAPIVHITDVRKMSPKGEEKSVGTYQDKIVLAHDAYYLSIDYAALNYNRPEKNQYAYMLEGFEDQWNYSSMKTPAIYTNLDPGTYTFKVKAANNDGVWNEEGTSISIIKKPALWETWWFRILSLILILILIFLGINQYTKNIKRRNRMLQKYNEDLNNEITQRKKIEKVLQEREQKLKESNFEIQKYNKELERSNEDLEQFAYIASHDLQEPLRVVGKFIGLLKYRYSKHFDEDANQYIDFAVNGLSRMSEQIRSILTFSKLSQNEIALESINLNELIENNLYDLSEVIEKKKVQFSIGKLPIIFCDKILIKIVFFNLISNAIKFNKSKNPLISIVHHDDAEEGFWKFSVKDNGIGIHKEYQIKIFNIFHRLHSKHEYEGTGIGLALCQKIIHRHGGEIWLKSEEGSGTIFYFTIAKNLASKPHAIL